MAGQIFSPCFQDGNASPSIRNRQAAVGTGRRSTRRKRAIERRDLYGLVLEHGSLIFSTGLSAKLSAVRGVGVRLLWFSCFFGRILRRIVLLSGLLSGVAGVRVLLHTAILHVVLQLGNARLCEGLGEAKMTVPVGRWQYILDGNFLFEC